MLRFFMTLTLVWSMAFWTYSSTNAQNLTFPYDEGKHKGTDFETWTFFSHLSDPDSNQFGITIFFFTGKVVGLNASGVNVTIADERLKSYQSYQKIQYPIINRAKHTEGRLLEKYGRNFVRRDTKNSPFNINVDINDLKLTFSMDVVKSPVDFGQIPVGVEKFNRLYAIPRGKITANMRYKNQTYSLKGIGFFQHQWGDSPDKKSASDLFVVHFKDTTDMLVYHNEVFSQLNTMVISTKSDTNMVFRDFSARADTVITVGATQNRFPLQWEIDMTNPPLKLNLKPLYNGQEVNILGLPYWLSRCAVNGQIDNKNLSGKGYVHLRSLLLNDELSK